MYNLKLLAKVRQKLEGQIPFLSMLCERMKSEKPYQGLRIIHKVPVTLCTVVKVEALLLGGADVIVSSTKAVNPQLKAVKILKDANVAVNFDQDIPGPFDLHLDCCAELIDCEPKIGTVELTQTGSHRYQAASLNYPVISVDDCKLKSLETIGTGYSFIEGFTNLTGHNLRAKKVIVFGYGKVGKGIVRALQAHTQHIVIVEKNDFIINTLKRQGLNAIAIQNINHIKDELKTAFCAVTATGNEGFVSKFLTKNDFNQVFLANMGAVDEYGGSFKKDDVLFGKKPINFSLSAPTKREFLDPILYAHNIAIDMLLKGSVPIGVRPFPTDSSNSIINEWQSIHSLNVIPYNAHFNSNINGLKRNNLY